MSGTGSNPPTSSNASRVAKIAWSPVAIPDHRERALIAAESKGNIG